MTLLQPTTTKVTTLGVDWGYLRIVIAQNDVIVWKYTTARKYVCTYRLEGMAAEVHDGYAWRPDGLSKIVQQVARKA